MPTHLAPAPGRHDHPPQPIRSGEPHHVRRVGLIDRAAMHLGVALIRWGRRPVTVRRHRPIRSPESVHARQELDGMRDRNLLLKLSQFR